LIAWPGFKSRVSKQTVTDSGDAAVDRFAAFRVIAVVYLIAMEIAAGAGGGDRQHFIRNFRNIAFRLTQISRISPAVPSHRGAARDRHGRGAGCGGRGRRF